MRAICDSSHKALGIKMPVLKGRESSRSIINKFCNANIGYLNKKYINVTLDAMTAELAKDILNDTIKNINKANAKMAKYSPKNEGAWVDTGKGYKVMPGF